MAKNVFNPIDIIQDSSIAYIDAPTFAPGILQEVEQVEVPVYDGPTIDELQAEAEQFTTEWAIKKEAMIAEASKQAAAIIQDANEKAAAMALQVEQDINAQRENFKLEHKELLEKAALEAEQLKEKAKSEVDTGREQAKRESIETGREEGYKEGYAEVERLIERLHTIINRTVDKRADILDEVETQVIELSLLMVRKVVKVIAENQKNVVINNVIQALKKLKSRSDITIRVNLEDIEMVSNHKELFIKNMEGDGKVNFIEDNSIERGGCIVETDFGEIDARISSQLSEIENRIRDLMPINVRPKMAMADDSSLYGE